MKKRRLADEDIVDGIDVRENLEETVTEDAAAAEEEESEEVVTYNILEGSHKSSVYATLCLLVPESISSIVMKALEESESKMFDWSIVEDEVVTDIRNIPTALTHPIHSLDDADLQQFLKSSSSKKSETELLDWLIHGESFFRKKYVVIKIVNGRYPDKDTVLFENHSTMPSTKLLKQAIETIFSVICN